MKEEIKKITQEEKDHYGYNQYPFTTEFLEREERRNWDRKIAEHIKNKEIEFPPFDTVRMLRES